MLGSDCCHSRRDGTPFINLIMCVPLRDQHGKVRYFLGAQLDITELVQDCTELESLGKLVEQQRKKLANPGDNAQPPEILQTDAFEQLGETFNSRELEVLLKMRRRLNPGSAEDKGHDDEFTIARSPAVSIQRSSTDLNQIFRLNGQGSAPPLGFYQNVRWTRYLPIACLTKSL